MSRDPDTRLVRRTMARLGLQSAAAVLVAVTLLGVAVVLIIQHTQVEQQNSQLATAIATADDVTDPPAGVWLTVRRGGRTVSTPRSPRGLPDEASLGAVAADGMSRTVDVHSGHHEYRVRTDRRGDAVVQAALDLRYAHEERDRLLQVLLLAGGVGLLIAGLTGAWVARRAVTPLVAALALQRRFVADAGHELRTPLTLLSTRAQMLRRRMPAESEVDGLVADTHELAAILDDLLLAADPREQTPRRPVDLAALLGQAVAAAEPAAHERGVRLSLTTVPAKVHGYEGGLRRAVNALLDNGIRHAQAAVRVVLTSSGRRVRVDVVDDGPGIEAALLPTLFTRFASVPADTTRDERRRYGLGLSLVSEIAARHGGTVTARNHEDGGAVLSLTLPRSD
ncbi:sensor histidine kinase [Actinophytocola oryzae]|uniref:histidine kinase n=1 Tax=Actinophytocola oryzae TaxID=502181 RepID=A0A4R7V3Z8_9PSEU|nr:HAMP domain-containing sensor histidine kinase [Actinophytocola oryzae]TDV44123.1 phospho-acceptor domain-containing protein [Actinophytocola oryzae]